MVQDSQDSQDSQYPKFWWYWQSRSQDSRDSQNPQFGGLWESRESWLRDCQYHQNLGYWESWESWTMNCNWTPRLPGLPKPLILRVLGLLGVLGVLDSNKWCLQFNGQWTTDIKVLKKVSGGTKWCYSESSLSLFFNKKILQRCLRRGWGGWEHSL